jgi:hypothetical protein
VAGTPARPATDRGGSSEQSVRSGGPGCVDESQRCLAVIAPTGWDGRTDLEDAVRTRLGNFCDVLVFTPENFTRLPATDEPVVREILTEGIALIGSIP